MKIFFTKGFIAFLLFSFFGIFFGLQYVKAAPVTLVEFTFENTTKRSAITDTASFLSSSYTADGGITGNINVSALSMTGGMNFSSWSQGAGGVGTFAPNLNNSWASGSGSKYWVVQFSTQGYENLTLSSKQRSSSTGPRDFQVQYSTGGLIWFDVVGASVTVGDNFTSGVLSDISLDASLNNTASIYVRWIMTSDTAVGGAAVQSTGTSRIDDILIEGELRDIQAPVVTLLGSGSIQLIQGNTYTELGATWVDNIDGTGSLLTASSGSVNTAHTGTYILEYSYTDVAGNTGSVIRTVLIDPLICPAGREFQTLLGIPSCVPCPLGTYNAVIGGVCLAATPGYFVALTESTQAEACPAGYFTNNTGSISCSPAPTGSFIAGTGAIQADLCSLGSYTSSGASTTCTPAGIGYFISATGASSQTPCTPGSYTSFTGQSSCTESNPGYFVAGSGAIVQQICPAGAFSSSTGSLSCTLASLGSFSLTGAIQDEPCAPGSYSSTLGNSSCILAGLGTFISGTGAMVESLCAPGTFSNMTGSTTCQQAPLGSFVSLFGASEADVCSAGTFSNTLASTLCSVCPSGYTSAVGAMSCSLVPAIHTISSGASGGYDRCGPLGDLSGNSRDGACAAPVYTTDNNQKPLSEEEKKIIIQKVENDLDILFENVHQDAVSQTENTTFIKKVGEKEVLYTLENSYESCMMIESLNNPSSIGREGIFPDIGISPQKEIIERFATLGIIKGTKEGSFEPLRPISRVEFTKVVLGTHCYSYDTQDSSNLEFTDVPKDSWQAQVISKAQDLGIISGDTDIKGNKIFRPDAIITKAEALKILLRMAVVKTQLSGDTGYTDIAQSDWVREYVHTAEVLGIVTPQSENPIFGPQSSVTREEMIALIYVIVDLYRP